MLTQPFKPRESESVLSADQNQFGDNAKNASLV